LLNAQQDTVTVHLAQGYRFQDQKVKRAVQQFG
jgi:hypothetical protein